MTVAFTLCSNNYLAMAKVLMDSLKRHHPDYKLCIGLMDEPDETVDYDDYGCEILVARDVYGLDIEELSKRFDIVELSTTMKPFYLKHFFSKPETKSVIYLDPDIQVYSRLDEVERGLEQAMVTLTPHMLTPVDDEFSPTDKQTLQTGVFNLGFIGLSRHPQLEGFLDWWGDRCLKYGYGKAQEGMFYDQIWINYVPTFYESHFLIRHPGYNVANWNLHERHLKRDESEKWWVNEEHPLTFFHFSHYDMEKPQAISSYHTRYDFDNRPDLAPLFESYQEQLVQSRGHELSALKPHYQTIYDQHLPPPPKKRKKWWRMKRLRSKLSKLFGR